MSAESIQNNPRQLTVRELEYHIQEHIDNMPPELQQRWNVQFENMEDSALPSLLKNIEEFETKRSAALSDNGLHAFEGLRHAVTDPEAIARTIETIRHIEGRYDLFVGEGKIGHVFADPEMAGLCHKFIHDFSRYADWNSIDHEASYLEKLEGVSFEGARAPILSGAIDTPDLKVISMELLDAPSVDQVLMQRKALPEGFDLETFLRRLSGYIELMHKHHVYHRDMHSGNVLIGRDSTPYIIDFGRSVISISSDAAYEVYDRIGNRAAVLKSDEERVADLRIQLSGLGRP